MDCVDRGEEMRRRFAVWVGAAILGLLPMLAAADALLPEADDLAADGRAATATGVPILIEMSRRGCIYCEKVREDFLKPMVRSGDYRGRVIFRQLHVDAERPLIDFDGRRIGPREFARRYHVGLTPTVLLLDAQGRLLAKPLVGLTTEDFYGAILDEAIDEASARLRKKRGI